MLKKTRLNNNELIKDILRSLEELGDWGSLEIYVQDGKVTQITRRAIKKTNHNLKAALDRIN